MFWPSPEETLNNEEVVVCPARQYIDQSFYIKRELGSMASDIPNEAVDLLEFSKPQPLCYSSSGISCCNVFYKTSSPQAARNQRHRQSACHLEFPR